MSDLLETARALVEGDRARDYGDVTESFTRIAGMWGAYLGCKVSPHDVAHMMVLLKVSRLRTSPLKVDNAVDVVGYLLCAGKLNPDVAGM